MAKHIGIVACSAEGAALCYRTICHEAVGQMGKHNHPEITMSSIPMARYLPAFEQGNLTPVIRLLLESAEKVAKAGAEFAICPDNTCHLAFDEVAERSPIPWIHIGEAVADEAELRGSRKVGILGTIYTMEGDMYPQVFAKRHIGFGRPERPERLRVNDIIFDELVRGVFTDESRQYFVSVIQMLKDEGCDAVVLGCTEIPLLIAQQDSPLPVLDSTRLLAKAALRRALS